MLAAFSILTLLYIPYFADGQENTTIEYFDRHGLRESNVTHMRVRGTNRLHVSLLLSQRVVLVQPISRAYVLSESFLCCF